MIMKYDWVPASKDLSISSPIIFILSLAKICQLQILTLLEHVHVYLLRFSVVYLLPRWKSNDKIQRGTISYIFLYTVDLLRV